MGRFFLAMTATILCVSAGRAAPDPKDADVIKRSIRGGQDYLRAVYGPGARGPGGAPFAGFGGLPGDGGAMVANVLGGSGIGPGALAGMALLESGVPANDPAVVNITRSARAVVFSTKSTYELSLLIMFLDRLGQKEDRPLIQFLTLRLMSGQMSEGTWSYSCNGIQIDAVEERQLQAELTRDAARLVTPKTPGKTEPKKGVARPREDLDFDGPSKKDSPKKEEPKPEEPKKEVPGQNGLHPALEKYVRQAQTPGGVGTFGGAGDHSNTQFATVGLWVGRRHFVDVRDALTRVDRHYRDCQDRSGGWGYTGSGGESPAMTCAGLMGLAIGFGAKNLSADGKDLKAANPEEVNKDPVVANGLKYIGTLLMAAADNRDNGRGRLDFQLNDLTNNLYFMWSLERVGMVYGMTTIGKVDWYDWGSRVLVRTQQRDGSWPPGGGHVIAPDVATSFALLFLSRANLAEDLSASLKGKVRDPGTSRLVGGTDLSDLLKNSTSGSSPTRKGDNPKPKGEAVAKGPTSPAPMPMSTVDEATKLANALVAATGPERSELVKKYRDTKGADYTDALALAIPRLPATVQPDVREALASRLTRMTPATLNGLMRHKDKELRGAAALACSAKGKDRLSEVAGELIRLIGDPDAAVAQYARASLKALTEQDFGPEPTATAGERGQALLAWKRWWETKK